MNRDWRAPKRRASRLRAHGVGGRARASEATLDPADVAPWVIADVRRWPRSVEDRLVAAAVGVQPQHVRMARKAPS
jgi:hypothetical protein